VVTKCAVIIIDPMIRGLRPRSLSLRRIGNIL